MPRSLSSKITLPWRKRVFNQYCWEARWHRYSCKYA